MRRARIKEAGAAYYHIHSRIVDRQMLLDEDEKERFRRLMRKVEAFSGVRVITWAAMSNHFHILLLVPERKAVSDQELIRRLGHLYKSKEVQGIARELQRLRETGRQEAAEALKRKYTYRMYDLSEFGKTLKQRFTQGFNARHERTGTLWEQRFKSVLVQSDGRCLSTIGAYIDLNPVRAGLVKDPKDYRFCGYAEAMGGNRRAREGLARIAVPVTGTGDWQQTRRLYRQLLYLSGEKTSVGTKAGFSPEEVQAVLDGGGSLSRSQLLRCRVRYFTDGMVLGTRAYVRDALGRHGASAGRKRIPRPRSLVGCDLQGLHVAHPLRRAAIIPAAMPS